MTLLKVGMVSLGCPKNLVDTEIMLGILIDSGYSVTNRDDQADILIINTCSFVEEAKQESINTVLSMTRWKTKGRCRAIVITGCLAQRHYRELAVELPEVDGFIGTGNIHLLPGFIKKIMAGERLVQVGSPGFLHTADFPRVLTTPLYTAYIKIAEGCNNCCSYCIIPQVRGRLKSRTLEDIVCEASGLVKRGARELILVAQDTTDYGLDLYGRPALEELITELLKLEDLVWLRLLYAYPEKISERLVNIIASNKKVCSYLDMPMQHVSGSILSRMKRNGCRDKYYNLVTELRSKIPDVTLRTTFIVGFPGESESDFTNLLDFISEVKFERLGVFTYSREEGTAAANLPGQLPEETKFRRKNEIMTIQRNISFAHNRSQIGKTLKVLVEGVGQDGRYYGRTQGDAPEVDGKVIFISKRTLSEGSFVNVVIGGAGVYDLTGVTLPEQNTL